MPHAPVLSFGCAFSDRIEALLDGRVAVNGFTLDIRLRQPQTLFREVLRDQAHDLAEMSLGSHIANVGAGRTDYVGLPIFLSRAFRHSNIYVRTDRVGQPSDLNGKTIGVIDYQQTAALWARGLLADEHGVDRRGLRWVAGGLNAPVAEGRGAPPRGLDIHRTDETLDALLARGDLDAIISPTAPRCFVEGHPRVRRLFPDPRGAEFTYHKRTGIFPIMHCLVVRKRLVEAHPQLPAALQKAFEDARRLAIEDLDTRDYPKIATPWISEHRRAVRLDLGQEIWTYGLDGNSSSLEAALRYAHEDRLTERKLKIEEVFQCEPHEPASFASPLPTSKVLQ